MLGALIREIPNRLYRRWLLALGGLAPPFDGDGLHDPRGARGAAWVAGAVRRLGFVQVDPIRVVSRAQDQILFARRGAYRPRHLRAALERERTLFENWTHDAAILPADWFPYWRHYMDRFRRFEVHPGYRRYFAPVTGDSLDAMRRVVRESGPVRPREIESEKLQWDVEDWPAPTLAKVSLEFLWRTGELAISHREGQEKHYDLAERVIPEKSFERRVSRDEYAAWACRQALLRLGAATPAQIAHFFDAVPTEEAAGWCEKHAGGDVETVVVHGGRRGATRTLYALRSSLERLEPPAASSTLRFLSPFDPLIHDRKRTEFVFGFEYAVEIFVPAKKRKYGYYVMPMLEGERLVGRIDMKCDRKAGRLDVLGLWWEDGVKVTATRRAKLDRQLERQARFCGMEGVGKLPRR